VGEIAASLGDAPSPGRLGGPIILTGGCNPLSISCKDRLHAVAISENRGQALRYREIPPIWQHPVLITKAGAADRDALTPPLSRREREKEWGERE